jgi:hypothetical protein
MKDATTVVSAIRAAGREVAARAATLRERVGISPTEAQPPPAKATAHTEAVAQALRDDPRPHWDGRSLPTLAPVQQFTFIYAETRATADELLGEQRDPLKTIHTECAAIRAELKGFSAEKLTARRIKAKRNISAGRGTQADVEFNRGNFSQARKMLVKQLQTKLASARPLLEIVAKRVEDRARRVLPQVEADAVRLGIRPVQSPVVAGIASACWAPSILARETIEFPARFLARLGIKL